MSNLVNRFPIDPATGKVLATLNTPLPIWGENGGWTYEPVTEALAMIDAVPAASDPWLGGLRFNAAGSLYVWTAAPPAQVFVLGGLPVTFDGRLIADSGPIVGYSNGLPVTASGGISVAGLGPQVLFFAPLLSTLVPTTAVYPSFNFSRNTTAYATAVGPTGNAVDGLMLIPVAAHEARFAGARRISQNVWSDKYADGTPIPAANLLGLVFESSASNLVLQSQTFDNASWVKTNGTITPNTTVAPDGTLTGETFAATGVNGVCLQSVTVVADTHAFSIYMMRLAGTSQVTITTDGVTYTDITSQLSSSVWTRVSTVKVLSAGTVTPGVRVAVSGDSVAIWGAQLEAGTFTTSYIPTTTIAVARQYETLDYGLGNFLTDKGSAYAEAITYSDPADTNPHSLVASDSLWFLAVWTGYKLSIHDGSVAVFTAASPTLGVQFKTACRWSTTPSSTRGIVLNGGAVATGGFDGTMGGVTLRIGNGSNSSNGSLRGMVRNVKIYGAALSDAEMVALTT